MFGGDFYRYSTTTVDLVRKMRRDLYAEGIKYEGFEEVQKVIDEHVMHDKGPDADLTSWAEGLNLPRKGENILFVDYYNAFQTREVPIAAAKILKAANVNFAILDHPAVTTGELYETDENAWVEAAKRNIKALQDAGAKTVILVNPHEFSYFVKEYPRYVGTLPFKVVFITDFVNDLIKAGKITFKKEYNKKVTFHDPCSLNKLCGIFEAPREIIAALPGAEAEIEDAVIQWKYCCGNGVSTAFRKALPDAAYRVSTTRLRRANDVGAEVLLVACPHCKDMFTEAKVKSGINIEPIHILEAVAEAMGIEG
jgi:Fe-S oxidoreductase